MVNWEFFDNQTPQSAKQLVDDLRAGRDVTPTRGPSRLCTWKQANRILAGFGDGQAAEGPSAGHASLVGLKLAKEARTGRRRSRSTAGKESMTDTLTPVLTANWDQPDSFTLDGYSRDRRVQGAAQGAGDGAGRRDRHGEERRCSAAAAAPASRPA